jgi:hypothetical protein
MPAARLFRVLVPVLFLLVAVPLHAQQTGAINGKVTASDGSLLPGVTVEATSPVLPTPRVTVTGSVGEYRMPALPPGLYTVTFTLSGMTTVTRQAEVQLAQDTPLDVTLSVGGVEETVEVTATATLIEKDSSAIKSSVVAEQIQQLPVGQQYRDLVKLIPGVMYTQDGTRGPSAGGSGQDNAYRFDGVNVTLPLFGTLSAEASSHDIAQVTTLKGGARAVDFERAGGFSIDSVSKSGTNRFQGQVSYQFQDSGMVAEVDPRQTARYDQDRTWLTLNGGGPAIPNRLYFYGSYYRPTIDRTNASNLYGDVPGYESTRDEGFGKLTGTPTASTLFNFSYRYSHRLDKGDTFGQTTAPTAGTGSEAWQKILTADGSWVINAKSFLSFKYTYFANPTSGRPDNVADVVPNTTPGTRLDVNNLDKIGRTTVPTPVAGADAYNAFVQPLIDRYGYTGASGAKTGGGTVGYGLEFNDQDFYRNQGQVAYNITLGSTVSHELHAGYQYYVDKEELLRTSNGWGAITVPGGRLPAVGLPGQPAYYLATFYQQGVGNIPPIVSSYRSQSIEVNDTIRWGNFTFNAGVLFSDDKLFGQGLKEDSSTISGYVQAPGNKYEMYHVPFKKMTQPRLGATWAYNGRDTLYFSFARYNPAASSLPRAASWARNLAGASIDAFFDQNGILFGSRQNQSLGGKLFVPDMTPRRVDEYMIGTARQFNASWSGRLYARYREGSHFWEDTNNNARLVFNPPPEIPRELYIPDLAAMLAQIGNGSSYVIAELDGAYTKYYDVTVESEWRGKNAFVRGSYTWSRYTGNFDQDNSTSGANNDNNIFIGSSNIADGAGRQLWNFKDGRLRGDRPHMLKVYGYYMLPWNATAGAYAIAQSGQPWEIQSYEPYIALTTSTSDVNRFAERAGSRRTESHQQVDLNYTQSIPLGGRLQAQVVADLYNVFDNQTPYNINPLFHASTFQQPQSFFAPRRFQLAVRLQF